MEHWDTFAESHKPEPITCMFKSFVDSSDGEPVLRPIHLGKQNNFRQVMQIIDLISLHADYHSFRRSTLALAIVSFQLMIQYGVIEIDPEDDLNSLR
jgi:hypothetical protein